MADLSICPDCKLFKEICLCKNKLSYNLKTKVSLLIHVKELNKITNSGKLINLSLLNKQIFVRGLKDNYFNATDIIDSNYENLILFPATSTVLSQDMIVKFNRPINLIVPDGTWQQASKMIRREKLFHQLRFVKLPEDIISFYRIRTAHRKEYLSTFEALSHAIGIIENEAIKDAMINLFNNMIDSLLNLGGKNL